jgi:hypothetical protein
MKKALVLILILAVAGGLFAKGGGEAAGGDASGWSASGNVQLQAEIQLLSNQVGIGYRRQGTRAAAAVSYKQNGFQFDLGIARDDDDGHIRLNTAGTYTADKYGFKFGTRLQNTAVGTQTGTTGDGNWNWTGGTVTIALPDPALWTAGDTVTSSSTAAIPLRFMVTDAWGYYKFMDGKLTLKAAWIGGAENPWRTANVASGNRSINNGTVRDPMWWGNRGESLYVLFNPMDGLSIGFRLPSPFGILKTEFKDFFLDGTVFGAKYSVGNLGIGFMFSTGDRHAVQSMNVYAGVTVKLNDQMNIAFDLAAYDFNTKAGGVAMFAGVQFNYSNAPISASFTFRGANLAKLSTFGTLDVIATFGFTQGDFSVGLTLKALSLLDKAHKRVYDEDYGNLDGRHLRANISLGYQLTDAAKANVGIEYNIGLGTTNTPSANHSLSFGPEVVWTVFKNATMTFGYNLGYKLDSSGTGSGLTSHNIRVTFRWAF